MLNWRPVYDIELETEQLRTRSLESEKRTKQLESEFELRELERDRRLKLLEIENKRLAVSTDIENCTTSDTEK
jgi:hypothetical protein